MLTYLRVQNFRRHGDVELHFSDDAQLLLVSGTNGSGKTALLESIGFAFYGEGRNGKQNLDRLVKRGSEIEGLTVEIEFQLDGDTYRINRQRDERKSRAWLWGNDIQLAESSKGVTAAVEKLLGMDAAGFRMATYAQQKELDGLLSLTPTPRAEMLSRLLRLDAIRDAKDTAHDEFRQIRKALGMLGQLPDLDELTSTVETLDSQEASARGAVEQAEQAVAELDRQLGDAGDVAEQWQAAQQKLARAEGGLEAARSTHDQLAARRATLDVPDMPEPPARPSADVADELGKVETDIARAEQVARTLEMLEVTRTDLASGQEERADLAGQIERIESSGDVDQAILNADKALTDARTARSEAADTVRELTGRRGGLCQTIASLHERIDAAEQLEATCDECGQDIPHDHVEQVLADLNTQLTAAESQLDELDNDVRVAEQAATDAGEQVEQASRRVEQAKHDAAEHTRLVGRLEELDRRIAVWEGQLARSPKEAPDLDELYASRGTLTAELSHARETEQARHEATQARRDADDLDRQLTDAAQRLEDAQTTVDGAQIDGELADAHARYTTLRQQRTDEAQLAATMRTNQAVAAERAETARRELDRAKAAHARRHEQAEKARKTHNARDLLGMLHDLASTQVRPALEGAMSELLSRMSNHRFTQVRLTEGYDVLVHDTSGETHQHLTASSPKIDGTEPASSDAKGNDDESEPGSWQPLTEFSGGEADLIALALRLAIAGVISDQHGGGPGFLVLDECFGSQDRDRQRTILEALRQLRGRYGQIFLISHVDRIEDEVDRVIEVTSTDDLSDTHVELV